MANLLAEINAFQGRLSDKAAALVAKLDTKDGNIVPSKKNLAQVGKIIAELQGEFEDRKLAGAVAEFVKSFNTDAAAVIKRLQSFGKVKKEVVEGITEHFQRIAADAFTNPQAFTPTLFNPLADDLIFGISSSAPLSDTVANVTKTAKGYADLVVSTADGTKSVLNRTITTYIADEVGAEFFLFQGRSIATTRPWCLDKEGKVWHRKEIEEWGREAAAGNGWDGMVEGTNEKTIFIHLGGWYGKRGACRHILVPLDIMDVPKADLDRMRAKGLIK